MQEEEGFGAVVDVGNNQRAADGPSTALLQIRRIDAGLTGERERGRVQRSIVRRIVNRSVRLIDVEASVSAEDNRTSTPSAAASAKTAAHRATSSTGSASLLSILLKAVRTHAEKARRVRTGDRDRFRGYRWRHSRNRHAGRSHGFLAIRVLVPAHFTLQDRECLEPAATRSCATCPSLRVALTRFGP